MALKAVASLKDIKSLGIKPVVSKRNNNKGTDVTPKVPKPVFNKTCNYEEILSQFRVLTNLFFTLRSGEEFDYTAIGDCLIDGLTGDIAGGKGLPEKMALRAIEELVLKAGAGREGKFSSTRTRRAIELMGETPYMSRDGDYGRLVITENDDVREVNLDLCERRDASTVLEVIEETYGKLPYDFLFRLETAKVTKMESLRRPEMKLLRATTPDFGICMIPAMLEYSGFKNGKPVTDLVRTNYPTLSWVISVLDDFRNVLTDADLDVYAPFLSEMTMEEYAALAQTVRSVEVGDGDPMIRRKRAKERYEADKAHFDEARVQFVQVEKELAEIQQEAITIVKDILELVAFKKSEKDWYRALNAQNNKGGASHAVPPLHVVEEVEEVVEPTLEADTTHSVVEDVHSVLTPDQAVESLGDMEVEVDIGIPRCNNTALQFSEVERKEAVQAAGLDGARMCEAYPGVVWEVVIGPVDHAMDIHRTETDCQMVVIAPRRVGGMGLNMEDCRALLVDEYESYFTKI